MQGLSKQVIVALSYFILPLGVYPKSFVSAENSLLNVSSANEGTPHGENSGDVIFANYLSVLIYMVHFN